MMLRRPFLASLASLVALTSALVMGCGTAPVKPDPQTVATLAPTGTLRIGVYKGSPTSLVTAADGKPAGVAHDVGNLMAAKLGIPAQVVTFDRVAQVLEALKTGKVDMTFTNASSARQLEFSFTKPLLSLELGYLAPTVPQWHSLDKLEKAYEERWNEIDQAGKMIGVSQGSSSQAALATTLKAAKLKTFASLDAAKTALRAHEIDAFATNKAILFEMEAQLAITQKSGKKSFVVLPRSWGQEHMGIAIAKERASASAFAQAFGDELKQSGELARIATRAGLRGLVEKE